MILKEGIISVLALCRANASFVVERLYFLDLYWTKRALRHIVRVFWSKVIRQKTIWSSATWPNTLGRKSSSRFPFGRTKRWAEAVTAY